MARRLLAPDRAARAEAALAPHACRPRRRRDEHDLRATIRASLRHGGELLERRYREQASARGGSC